MRRILVVDDETAICQVLTAFMNRIGYAADEADSIKSARVLVQENDGYDLIITDMVLDDGSSVDFIDQMKQSYPQTKVIAMTGDSQIDEKSLLSQAERAGADLTFTKPFSLSDIKEKIENLLN